MYTVLEYDWRTLNHSPFLFHTSIVVCDSNRDSSGDLMTESLFGAYVAPTTAPQDWPAVTKRIEDFPKTERDVLHHRQLLSFIMSHLVKGFALVPFLGL